MKFFPLFKLWARWFDGRRIFSVSRCVGISAARRDLPSAERHGSLPKAVGSADADADGLCAAAGACGGDSGARAGTLSILVGGDQADFDACLPIFQAMGTNITYFGPAGCGQHAKMANQIMIAGALSGVCEALTYAKAEGLDGNTLLGAVSTGAAGSKQLDFQGKKILAGDFAPGFFMKHFVKDMRLAEEEAENAGLDLNVLQQALSNCQSLIDRGCGDLGTQALIKFYEK